RQIRARAGRAHAKRHVCILGIRYDESAGRRVRLDFSEFYVQRLIHKSYGDCIAKKSCGYAFTFAMVSLSARADCCSAICSLGQSFISTCFSTPLRLTTEGTLRQMSRMP